MPRAFEAFIALLDSLQCVVPNFAKEPWVGRGRAAQLKLAPLFVGVLQLSS